VRKIPSSLIVSRRGSFAVVVLASLLRKRHARRASRARRGTRARNLQHSNALLREKREKNLLARPVLAEGGDA